MLIEDRKVRLIQSFDYLCLESIPMVAIAVMGGRLSSVNVIYQHIFEGFRLVMGVQGRPKDSPKVGKRGGDIVCIDNPSNAQELEARVSEVQGLSLLLVSLRLAWAILSQWKQNQPNRKPY